MNGLTMQCYRPEEPLPPGGFTGSSSLADLSAIAGILEPGRLTTHFQPIYSSRDGSVFGHECLLRTVGPNPFGGIDVLFRTAHEVGAVSVLDAKSVETIFRTLSLRGKPPEPQALFINICPETLMNPDLTLRESEAFADRLGIGKDRIVLELTEESFISNYNLFRRSLIAIRRKGYRIAIDDFGAGYCGLKMLSTLEPDFVKIDRHFISRIDRTLVKYNLVDAIATACHRIGICVIAEGIERQEELDVVRGFGIDLLQGYLLARPTAELKPEPAVILASPQVKLTAAGHHTSQVFIGSILEDVAPLGPDASVASALERFQMAPELAALPVVANGQVIGIVNRRRFIEEQIVGKYGYAFSINYYKTISELMEEVGYEFEATATFEEVSAAIQARRARIDYCNICVTRNGRYVGMVDVTRLVDAVSDMNVMLAKGCNPLSGLPGNDFIQREIERRLVQNMHFDVAYIDIDNFKPFNDHYGFEKGDRVLRALAEIVSETVGREGSGAFDFAGHIGGDDFIIITRPRLSMRIARQVTELFQGMLPDFHGEDYGSGGYLSFNRRGEQERFPLLSLSIGIVSTEISRFTSYGELASVASEVKKAAKLRQGFSIQRDRRRGGGQSFLNCNSPVTEGY